MSSRRPATLADLSTLWELRTRAVRAGCAGHYPAAVIDIWCAAPAPASLPLLVQAGGAVVAEENGHIVGYAVLNLDTGELNAAFVEPRQQRRGIALQLLQQLESMACQRSLSRLFLSASLNAVPFYERAGFVSLRKELYPHRCGVDLASVFMEKQLARPC